MKKWMKKRGMLFVLLLLCIFVTGCARGEDLPDNKEEHQGTKAEVTPVTEPGGPTPTLSPEEETEQQILAMIEEMTLEEKVGQMFLLRCPGAEYGVPIVEYYQPAGYILFASDFENQTVDSIREIIAGYQAASGVPLLIAVDEEGGTVTRVSRFSAFRESKFASPQKVFAEGGMELVIADTIEKCQLLSSLGINMNLAPVCDVSTNPEDYMYDRSFGKSAEETADYIKNVVETMNGQNMLSALKHFPGYGNNVNTHTGIALDERPYEQFTEGDFLPFIAGIEAGASTVLVSHNIVCCMDEELPASLSPEVHRILREELAFDGVIVTDDLVMDAITLYTGAEAAAVLAVEAGNDLLIATNYNVQIPAVIAAVQDGRITEERIEESVFRILKMKFEYGLLN